MHELSVVQALVREIDAVVSMHGPATVRRVTVQVGPLSGVDPGLLASAFAAMQGEGIIAGSELVLEPSVVRVRCRDCGEQTVAAQNRLLCSHCGGYRTTLLSGDELVLRRVELVPQQSSP